MLTLRIFVASPGDVEEERDIVSQIVVPEVRRIFSEGLCGNNGVVDITAIRWETHIIPDVGDDAQDVVNNQIGEFDILVGMMWKRFGTPTKRADSGTGEEFDHAYELYKQTNKPRIMFYFRTTPFYTTNLQDITQFRKVLNFRKKLRDLGVVFSEYSTPVDFERKVREHLIRYISQIVRESIYLSEEKQSQETAPNLIVDSKVVVESGRILGIVSDARDESVEARKPNLFFSYVREDSEQVRKLYSVMRSVGFNPWLDVENLFPGQSWEKEINNAISNADFVLIFLSQNSIAKRGYFHKELKYALDRLRERTPSDVFVIPVRLEEVPVPESLRMLQWVDLFREEGPELLIHSIKTAWEKKQKEK